MIRQPSAPPSSSWASSGWSRAGRDCWPSASCSAARRPRQACAQGTAEARAGRASSGSGSARSGPRGRVAVAARSAERAALHALPERAAEAQRAPVLAAQPVADLALVHLPLLLEEVLDQGELAPEPPLVLVGVGHGSAGPGEGGEAGGAHRSPPLGRVRDAGSAGGSFAPPRSKRGACSVPRPSPRPSVYLSASSPGSASSS